MKREDVPRRTYRETPDVSSATARLIVTVGKRVATEDPNDLTELLRLDQALSDAWMVAVAGLRETGFSDSEIGRVLGITKQAVAQRWPRSSTDRATSVACRLEGAAR